MALALGSPVTAFADEAPEVHAAAGEDGIRIEVRDFDPEESLVVLRGLEPMTSPAELEQATEVTRLEPGEQAYVDTAPAGLPWYYAVVAESELQADDPDLRAGDNVTVEAERRPLTAQAAGMTPEAEDRPRRGRPLPRLNPDHSAITGAPLPPSALPRVTRREVAPETEAAIERLLERAPEGERHKPEAVRLEHEETGERSHHHETLRQIVRATIEQERWDEAIDYLNALRALSLSPSEEQHALFYLGQAHYFRSAYRQAVLYLLQVNETLYSESRPFIDAALNALAAGNGRR